MKVILLSTQNNFYIILGTHVGYVEEIKSGFHVFSWFSGLQNLDIFRNIYCRTSLQIIFRQK